MPSQRFFVPDQLIDVHLDELIIEVKPPQLGTNLVELKLIHGSKPLNFPAYSSLKSLFLETLSELFGILARPSPQRDPFAQER